MSKRLFEKGDLVVSKTYGVGVVHGSNTAREIKNPTIDFDGQYVTFYGDGRLCKSDEKPDIVCIRKPRKGSAEARDIVAMLAREYRKVFIHNLQVAISNDLFVDDGSEYEKEFWRLVKKGTRFSGVIQKKLYDKAKSMLK